MTHRTGLHLLRANHHQEKHMSGNTAVPTQ